MRYSASCALKTNMQIFTLLADGEDDDNGGGEDGNDDCQQFPLYAGPPQYLVQYHFFPVRIFSMIK